jgi:hypothetical protein
VALGLTHPLTEMSTRNLPEDTELLVHQAGNLTAIFEPVISTFHNHGSLQPVKEISSTQIFSSEL